MRKTTRLKNLIEAPDILVLPGAHDTLTARIIERAGFHAITMGGYSASASLLGKPDLSLLTLTEMVECFRRINDCINIPLLADGDTGHGGVFNVARTVREIERSGAAGIFIEDQVYPKRCGHMKGKQVIPAREMVAKLKAALDTRCDNDFVIMARTDALAVNGIDQAIERMEIYHEVGADLLFIEAPETTIQMRRICAELKGPCLANMIRGGITPYMSAKELQEIGYAVAAYPVMTTYVVAKAVSAFMKFFYEKRGEEEPVDCMFSFDAFNSLVGLNDLRTWEQMMAEFAADLIEKNSERRITESV